MSSEGPKAPHLRLAEHPSLRFARVSAHPTLGTPRFRSASLGVTEQCTIHDSQCTMIRQRSLSVTLSEASAEPKGLDMEEHSPLRFARGHADPAVGIPRLRFATLGMTEQFTIHNYSARSCCHVERRGVRPAVETSRRCGTFAITIHAGSRKYDRRDSSTMPGIKAKRPNCLKQFGRFASRCRLA